jgi:hypothetical protein
MFKKVNFFVVFNMNVNKNKMQNSMKSYKKPSKVSF